MEDNNNHIPRFNPQNKVYNESHEMAKFLETIVNNEMRTKHQTPEQRAYVERKMKNVDMEHLFDESFPDVSMLFLASKQNQK